MTPCQSAGGKEEGGGGLGVGGGGFFCSICWLGGEKRFIGILFPIIGGSCHKYHVCRDKHVFVATKVCLSRQTFCRDKHTFVAASLLLSRQARVCHDQTRLLSRPKFCVCLCSPPMIVSIIKDIIIQLFNLSDFILQPPPSSPTPFLLLRDGGGGGGVGSGGGGGGGWGLSERQTMGFWSSFGHMSVQYQQ